MKKHSWIKMGFKVIKVIILCCLVILSLTSNVSNKINFTNKYDFVEVVMFDEKKHRPWECDRLKTDEYCDTCDHEGCDNCVSDATNPYCVPSNYQQIKQE